MSHNITEDKEVYRKCVDIIQDSLKLQVNYHVLVSEFKSLRSDTKTKIISKYGSFIDTLLSASEVCLSASHFYEFVFKLHKAITDKIAIGLTAVDRINISDIEERFMHTCGFISTKSLKYIVRESNEFELSSDNYVRLIPAQRHPSESHDINKNNAFDYEVGDSVDTQQKQLKYFYRCHPEIIRALHPDLTWRNVLDICPFWERFCKLSSISLVVWLLKFAKIKDEDSYLLYEKRMKEVIALTVMSHIQNKHFTIKKVAEFMCHNFKNVITHNFLYHVVLTFSMWMVVVNKSGLPTCGSFTVQAIMSYSSMKEYFKLPDKGSFSKTKVEIVPINNFAFIPHGYHPMITNLANAKCTIASICLVFARILKNVDFLGKIIRKYGSFLQFLVEFAKEQKHCTDYENHIQRHIVNLLKSYLEVKRKISLTFEEAYQIVGPIQMISEGFLIRALCQYPEDFEVHSKGFSYLRKLTDETMPKSPSMEHVKIKEEPGTLKMPSLLSGNTISLDDSDLVKQFCNILSKKSNILLLDILQVIDNMQSSLRRDILKHSNSFYNYLAFRLPTFNAALDKLILFEIVDWLGPQTTSLETLVSVVFFRNHDFMLQHEILNLLSNCPETIVFTQNPNIFLARLRVDVNGKTLFYNTFEKIILDKIVQCYPRDRSCVSFREFSGLIWKLNLTEEQRLFVFGTKSMHVSGDVDYETLDRYLNIYICMYPLVFFVENQNVFLVKEDISPIVISSESENSVIVISEAEEGEIVEQPKTKRRKTSTSKTHYKIKSASENKDKNLRKETILPKEKISSPVQIPDSVKTSFRKEISTHEKCTFPETKEKIVMHLKNTALTNVSSQENHPNITPVKHSPQQKASLLKNLTTKISPSINTSEQEKNSTLLNNLASTSTKTSPPIEIRRKPFGFSKKHNFVSQKRSCKDGKENHSKERRPDDLFSNFPSHLTHDAAVAKLLESAGNTMNVDKLCDYLMARILTKEQRVKIDKYRKLFISYRKNVETVLRRSENFNLTYKNGSIISATLIIKSQAPSHYLPQIYRSLTVLTGVSNTELLSYVKNACFANKNAIAIPIMLSMARKKFKSSQPKEELPDAVLHTQLIGCLKNDVDVFVDVVEFTCCNSVTHFNGDNSYQSVLKKFGKAKLIGGLLSQLKSQENGIPLSDLCAGLCKDISTLSKSTVRLLVQGTIADGANTIFGFLQNGQITKLQNEVPLPTESDSEGELTIDEEVCYVSADLTEISDAGTPSDVESMCNKYIEADVIRLDSELPCKRFADTTQSPSKLDRDECDSKKPRQRSRDRDRSISIDSKSSNGGCISSEIVSSTVNISPRTPRPHVGHSLGSDTQHSNTLLTRPKVSHTKREEMLKQFLIEYLTAHGNSASTKEVVSAAYTRYQNQHFANSVLAFEAYLFSYIVSSKGLFSFGTRCGGNGVTWLFYRPSSGSVQQDDQMSFIQQLLPDIQSVCIEYLAKQPDCESKIDNIARFASVKYFNKLYAMPHDEIQSVCRAAVLISAIHTLKKFIFAKTRAFIALREEAMKRSRKESADQSLPQTRSHRVDSNNQDKNTTQKSKIHQHTKSTSPLHKARRSSLQSPPYSPHHSPCLHKSHQPTTSNRHMASPIFPVAVSPYSHSHVDSSNQPEVSRSCSQNDVAVCSKANDRIVNENFEFKIRKSSLDNSPVIVRPLDVAEDIPPTTTISSKKSKFADQRPRALKMLSDIIHRNGPCKVSELRQHWLNEADSELRKSMGSGVSFALSLRKYDKYFTTSSEGRVSVNDASLNEFLQNKL